MSTLYTSQTLRSLKEGDTLHIKSINDYGESTMVINEIFEGGFGGTVRFHELGDTANDGEYGELYEEDFHLIYNIDYDS
jgi:hypothetical protein